MFRAFGAAFLLGSILLLSHAATRADEKSDEEAKQKELVAANLKKLELKSPVVETENLFVTGTLAEKDLKAIADRLQKQYAFVYKSLKFEAQDKLIRGKLAVYCFTNKREYGSFARLVRQERPEQNETNSHDVSGDVCYMAMVVDGTVATTDPEVFAALGVAILERKAGIDILPPWLKIGYRKAVAMRMDAKYGDTSRKQVRALVGTKSKSTVKVKDAWQGDSPDKLLIAASLVDYMAFGSADAGKFISFMAGFKPSEDVPNPTVANALTAAGLKEDDLDKAWRGWVVKGK